MISGNDQAGKPKRRQKRVRVGELAPARALREIA